MSRRVLGFDTESKGLDWFDPDQQAFLVSWADDTGSYVCGVDDIVGLNQFDAAIERADCLVAHNLSFDVHMIRESIDLDLLQIGKELVDTDLLARVVLPERRFGADAGYRLKDLAKTYLRADAQEAEQAIIDLAESIGVKLKSEGGYYEVWRAYPAEMEHYAKLDAEYARDLLPILEAKLNDNTRRAWDLERATAPTIIRAEQRGVKVDPAIVTKLKAEYEPLAAAAGALVTAELGADALTGSDAMLEALLAHGVPLTRTTPTGKLATNKFALQEFEDDFPVLKALSDWRQAEKFLSTYIAPMVDRDVVHPSFWQMGAWTSRMSCSRPNMQNIPTRSELSDVPVRAAFVPRDGMCFVVCDYDSIELRLLAYYLNDPTFKQLIADGYDGFAWIAAEMDGGTPEDYVKGSPGEKRRGDLKNVTYAIIYGAGGGRIGDMLGLDPGPFFDEDHPAIVNARAIGKQWPKVGYQNAAGRGVATKVKATLPGYKELSKRVRKKIELTGFVTTLYGHRQVVSREKSYVGLNALIQGSAAGIFKAGIVAAEAAVEHLGAYPVLFVHDEVVIECPIEHADEVLDRTLDALEQCYELDPPLKVSGSWTTKNYAEGK